MTDYTKEIMEILNESISNSDKNNLIQLVIRIAQSDKVMEVVDKLVKELDL